MTETADKPGEGAKGAFLPEIALCGIPVETGAGHRGCVMGPAALRTAGLGEKLAALGHTVSDHGDIAPEAVAGLKFDQRAHNAENVAGWVRGAARHSYALLGSGAFPLFLGGDHSLAMGTVAGAARFAIQAGRPLHVLWLDAHADFNTPATSPSGNMHGMVVGMLCGEPGFAGILGDDPGNRVRPDHVHMFGIRSIDASERQMLNARGVNVTDMRTIDEFGVPALMRGIIDRVQGEDALLHVSLDVDFLDPAIAPAVGTTVPGGATYREAHLVMEMLYDSGLVTSLDVVELNPFLDERGRTARVLVEMIGSLFGQQILDRPAAFPDRKEER